MSFHLEQLILTVKSAAEWRAKRAQQFPDDERNSAGSRSLQSLSEKLLALPSENESVSAYDEVMNQAIDIDDALAEVASYGTHYIGFYGFEYPRSGDPDEFLKILTLEYREIVNTVKERIAEEKREEQYEAIKDSADEAAKEAAEATAKRAAEEAARDAAEEAYKEVYEETYGEVHEEAYKEALIEAVSYSHRRELPEIEHAGDGGLMLPRV